MASKRHRKASHSAAHHATWHDGRRQHLVVVRGDKQKKRLEATLAALPWVSQVEFMPLRR